MKTLPLAGLLLTFFAHSQANAAVVLGSGGVGGAMGTSATFTESGVSLTLTVTNGGLRFTAINGATWESWGTAGGALMTGNGISTITVSQIGGSFTRGTIENLRTNQLQFGADAGSVDNVVDTATPNTLEFVSNPGVPLAGGEALANETVVRQGPGQGIGLRYTGVPSSFLMTANTSATGGNFYFGSPIPEPSSSMLILAALVGFGFRRVRVR